MTLDCPLPQSLKIDFLHKSHNLQKIIVFTHIIGSLPHIMVYTVAYSIAKNGKLGFSFKYDKSGKISLTKAVMVKSERRNGMR